MTPERWQQIEKIFQSVLDRPPADRAAFLDEACAGDNELRKEVESLIASDEQAGSFIAPVEADFIQPADETSLSGSQVGFYKLIREVGRGGMGSVYLAVRADDEYRKQVAVKLIRRGLDSDFIIRRFRNERQILAALDHPNIARLLDGGTTEDGLPYFVMEYIEGLPIDRYCWENGLSINERLNLFRSVCSAVHYAHQNLVIHRDTKPGNILVTAEGVPKLLDFGIAKLLTSDLAAQTLDQTAVGMRMMTPDYASPEQIRGEQITTASDVYSLGVVLYELLTGQHPHHLRSIPPNEIARVICEQEPERPSDALTREEGATTSDETARTLLAPEQASRKHEGNPDWLRRRLAGDLDNIVLMAMRKEKERRYSSVEQFSEDIRRHLAGLPVIARKDTLSYRAGKFIRRHRVGVIAAVLIVIALLAGLGATLWQARVARAERARAEAEQARAERRFNDVRKLANSFLFEFHDAIENLSGSTKARELVIKRAMEYLDSLAEESGDDPSLLRELTVAYLKVGDINDAMGNKEEARRSYDMAVAMNKIRCERLDSPPSEERLASDKTIALNKPKIDAQCLRDLSDSYARLSDLLAVTGDTAGALELSLQALSIDEKLATENPDDAKAKTILAGSYMGTAYLLGVTGNKQGELDNYGKALQIREEVAAADANNASVRADLADSLRHLGVAMRWRGPTAVVITYLRRALAVDYELSSSDPTNARARFKLSTSYWCLGEALEDEGDSVGALENYRSALAIREQMAAADPQSATARSSLAPVHINIGRLLVKTGDPQGAIRSARRALEISQSISSAAPTNARVRSFIALCHLNLGEAREKMGDTGAALASYVKAAEILEPLAAADPKSTEFHFDLAKACLDSARLYCTLASKAKLASNAREDNLRQARSWHQKGLDVYMDMRGRGVLSDVQSKKLDGMLNRCYDEVDRLQGR
ncbi:MAG: protein kinase [Acidobacteriota bacterium]